ncbi:HAD family hydrolase [Amycolatopsis acidicola]|uniref:HAD family hydrolase n=1 Tax=Amycolatopsis acidicola TaxID=2596893 RepID=UPI001FB81D9B|nr:HAD family phosphatase [Amycolatopsis acidicola]
MSELALQAAVFDCDGLLLDTASTWARAFTVAAAAVGRRLDERQQTALVGSSVSSAAELITEWVGRPGSRAGVATILHAALRATIDECPPPVLPGVPALLDRLSGELPLGVASNAPADVLGDMLARSGLRERFGTVVSADAVARPKPAPDVYLAACRNLGVRPENVVALEDSPAGALAAQAAGLSLVVVTASDWPSFAPLPWPARPVLYVTTMEDPAVARLLSSRAAA